MCDSLPLARSRQAREPKGQALLASVAGALVVGKTRVPSDVGSHCLKVVYSD